MAEQLAKSIKEEFLCCSICIEQYTIPKKLPCQHTFCKKCLLEHVTNTMVTKRTKNSRAMDGHIHCPLCRNEIVIKDCSRFDIKEWISELPGDFLVDSLLQKLHLHDEAPQTVKHCASHGGKIREAYCFMHAQLICWECAARDHRACNVDSAEKARPSIEPKIGLLRKEVCGHLVNAREMCKSDQTFADSKKIALDEIDRIEKDLDVVMSSAKQQLAVLRTDIERHSRMQLQQRKGFYDVVTSLFELEHSLESLGKNKDTVALIATLETIRNDTEVAKKQLEEIGPLNPGAALDRVVFVPDDRMVSFLNSYSGVGFVDTQEDGGSDGKSENEAPMSIAHLLRRRKPNE